MTNEDSKFAVSDKIQALNDYTRDRKVYRGDLPVILCEI